MTPPNTTTPNWQKNINIISKEPHSYIRLTCESQAEELMSYLEWLLPYNCENSKLSTIERARIVIEKCGEAYLHIFGFSYHHRLNRVVTLCTSVSHFASCADDLYVVDWDQLNHPLYNDDDRDDSNLDEEMQLLLITLSDSE